MSLDYHFYQFEFNTSLLSKSINFFQKRKKKKCTDPTFLNGRVLLKRISIFNKCCSFKLFIYQKTAKQRETVHL